MGGRDGDDADATVGEGDGAATGDAAATLGFGEFEVDGDVAPPHAERTTMRAAANRRVMESKAVG